MSNPQKIFSQVYDQYVDKIYRFVFLKVNSQEIAEDLTSETFFRGWQVFKKQEVRIENPPAFLYKIAKNLVIDYYREKGKTKIISAEYPGISDPRANLEEKALLSSDFEVIHQALANIKENYQEVIIWHYLDDLSISEVAKLLNKPEGTVRVMLHRGLKELRKWLNG